MRLSWNEIRARAAEFARQWQDAAYEKWVVEIRRSLAAKPTRGFHQARHDIGATRSFLVHAGEDRYPVSENREAVGVLDLAADLRARA